VGSRVAVFARPQLSYNRRGGARRNTGRAANCEGSFAAMPPGPRGAAQLAALGEDFRLCLALLTRLPVSLGAGPSPAPLGDALRLAPLVGVLVGLLGAGGFWLGWRLDLPPLATALLALAVGILVTGALHEDGLADTADGFGGGAGPARKLEIMRDSRLGSYGALALLLSVGLRAAALGDLARPGAAAAALIAAHGLSRAAFPLLLSVLPAARGDGLAAGAGRPAGDAVLLALALGAALALIALGLGPGLVAILVAALATLALAALARAQVGGHTGDVLGAAQQSLEVAVLLTAAALL
jgi:adenosylcobinamide-GDP ribazoletransferase